MKTNGEKNSFITIGLLIYIAGMSIIVISIFLSWYKYTIILNGKSQVDTFYPFGGWIHASSESSNTGLPDLFNSMIFMYYGIIIYAGVIIPTIILIMQKKKLSENQSKYISYLLYTGPILVGFTLIQFTIKLIGGGLYIPYLDVTSTVYQNGSSIASISLEKIYNVSIGLILNLIGLILLIYASCIIKNPNSNENDEDSFGSEKYLNQNAIKQNKINLDNVNQDKSKISLTKNEEKWNYNDFQKGIQQIEDEFVTHFSNIKQNLNNISQSKKELNNIGGRSN